MRAALVVAILVLAAAILFAATQKTECERAAEVYCGSDHDRCFGANVIRCRGGG